MSDKFTVEIISPDRSIIKEDTTEVIIPAYEGEMGILKDHIPLITFLRPGKIKIKDINEEFFVEEGIVEFANNNLLILSSTALRTRETTKLAMEAGNWDVDVELEKKIYGASLEEIINIIKNDIYSYII
mgnify:CR=1 FL=1